MPNLQGPPLSFSAILDLVAEHLPGLASPPPCSFAIEPSSCSPANHISRRYRRMKGHNCVLHARSPPDDAQPDGCAKESQIASFVIRSYLSSLQDARWHVVGSAAMAKRSPVSSVPFEVIGSVARPWRQADRRELQEGRNRPDIEEENQDRSIRDGRPNPANASRPVWDPARLSPGM